MSDAAWKCPTCKSWILLGRSHNCQRAKNTWTVSNSGLYAPLRKGRKDA